jgi:hypothetical protein
MRAWPLHIAFAIMLVGTLAAKERAADMLVDIDEIGLETAVTRVAQSHGLAFREYAPTGSNIRALAFEAPGCSQPVVVVLRITFDYEPLVQFVREQGNALRYVYIDRSWEKPDRLAFFVARMKYAVLATLGLTRSVPSGHMILVESPARCQLPDSIDWRDVWDRDYIAAARTDTEARI